MDGMLKFLWSLGDVDRRAFLAYIEQFSARVALRKLLEDRIKVSFGGGHAILVYRSAAKKIAEGELADLSSAEEYLRTVESSKAWEAQSMTV